MTGTVVDRSDVSTRIEKMQLANYSALKIVHGGAYRKVSLNSIRMLQINADETLFYNNQLYLSAELTLSDGMGQKSVFVCVNDVLTGDAGEDTFLIPLEYISTISID
ncbi:hypothetical protein QA601_06790 [Chitinispirillales bacterium ANBcel5]|uniref:hypothetical protein n=1 Tax=Cellulosispirillum alkaliphilum TaxID=3039283 RepID=UPI002A500025|nr:hypothetical protein [Chitinispirillales bacterium ANBcel5]